MAQVPYGSGRGWYNFTNAFSLALDSINAHKLRSFLTLLGVIIGVASVILVGAAIEGLGVYAQESTAKAFGSESYLVAQIASVGNLTRKEFLEKLRKNKRLRKEDMAYLRETTGDSNIYSSYNQKQVDVKREVLIAEETSIIGVGAAISEIRDIVVVDGRFLTEDEERTKQAVAVIGDELKTLLFPEGGSPVGKSVKIQGIDFRVIGVQEKLGSAFGRSQDKSAYIPASVYARMFGVPPSVTIFGRARPGSGVKMDDAIDMTRAALRSRFHTKPGAPDNFDTLTPDSIRGFIDQLLALVAAVVVPVTLISLVVGGIVIMNIMLVSVTERTREIGIRKSLGARQQDILLQILIEAVFLASVGGAIGVALGAALTVVVGVAFQIKTEVTFGYVMLALVVSSVVGVVSGWYPAKRAAALDPIVALRAE